VKDIDVENYSYFPLKSVTILWLDQYDGYLQVIFWRWWCFLLYLDKKNSLVINIWSSYQIKGGCYVI
jgi:hypothetical protein